MKKIFLTCFVGLGLVACNPSGTLPPPGEVANQTVLDEKAGIAVETMYTAVARAGALAFRAGLIQPSTNPAVQAEGFCTTVLSGEFRFTDRGSQVAALECELRHARDLTRAAYDAGNSDSYDTAAREAVRIGRQLLTLIGGN